MAQVTIRNGNYRNTQVRNQTFRLVADFKQGAKGSFVTVEDDGSLGYPGKAIRIKVKSMEDISVNGSSVADMSDSQRRRANKDDGSVFSIVKPAEPETYTETEEEAIKLTNNDPAVKNGIMKPTIYPYRVTLLRGRDEDIK